jgi:hypothetical protein
MNRYYAVRVGDSNTDLDGERFEDYAGARGKASTYIIARAIAAPSDEPVHVVRVESKIAKVVGTLR